MPTLHIPCETDAISDGFHTFRELYAHRRALFAALVRMMPDKAWMAQYHHDGTSIPGWFIAGIELPNGQISYHLPNDDWDLMAATGCTETLNAPKWDGHDAADVVFRLRQFADPSFIAKIYSSPLDG